MPFFLYKFIFKTLLSMGCILTSSIMATMNLLRNDVRSANSNNPSSALTAWAETKAIVRRPTPLTPHLELSNSLPKKSSSPDQLESLFRWIEMVCEMGTCAGNYALKEIR
jgi:hypothetical protein